MIDVDASTFPDQPQNDLSDFPDRVSDLENMYRKSMTVAPDHAAKVIEYSTRLNKSPSVVDKNVPMAEKAANAPSSQYWAEFEKNNPGVSKYLKENPHVMGAVQDDHEQLGWLENKIAKVSIGLMKGQLEAKRADLIGEQFDDAAKVGKRSSKNALEIEEVERRLAPFYEFDQKMGEGFNPVYQASAQIPNLVGGMKEGGVGAAAGAGVGAGATALASMVFPPAAATIPAAATWGARIGGAAGMGHYSYQVERNNAYAEYLKLTDKEGNPIDHNAAAKAANVVGAVNGTLETASDILLFGMLGKPVAKLGQGTLGAIAKIPGAEALAKLIGAQPKVFAGMTLRKALVEAGKKIALAEIGEVSTEVAQEMSTGLGGEFAKSQSGQDFEKRSMGEIASDSTAVIKPTAEATLMFGMFGGGSHVVNSMREIRRAEQSRAAYGELGEVAAAAKLKDRLPDVHEKLVEQLVQGTEVENVYIPLEAAETYFQEKGIDIDQAFEELGAGDQLSEAREQGLDIKIPYAKWAKKIVGTEHYNGLADDIKFSAEDLTAREARERSEAIEAEMQQEEETAGIAMQEDIERREDFDEIYSYIIEQQKIAGQSNEKLIDANAKIYASHVIAESARRGIDPIEYFSGHAKPVVVGESGIMVGHKESFAPELYNTLDPASKELADEYASTMIQDMVDEVSGAETGQRSSTQVVNDENNQGYLKQVNTSSKSTFPSWFQETGLNKKQFLKAVEKGQGKAFEKIKSIAHRLLADGYESKTSGFVMPNNEFRQLFGMKEVGVENQQDFDLFQSHRSKGLEQSRSGVLLRENEIEQHLFELPARVQVTNIVQTPYSSNQFKTESAHIAELFENPVFVNNKQMGNLEISFDKTVLNNYLDRAEQMYDNVEKRSKYLPAVKKAQDDYAIRYSVLKNIGEVLENAVHLHSTRKKKGTSKLKEVPVFHTLYSETRVSGKRAMVRIDVDRNADNKYEIKNIEIEEGPGNKKASASDRDTGHAVAHSKADAGISIKEFVHNVNNTRKKTFVDRYFQGGDKPRGAVSFTDGKSIVSLFKDADQSTFVHESAHIWLKDMFDFVQSGQANEKYLQEWAVLKDWLRIEDSQQDLTTEQQEQFARGFEAYLFEGNAPSKGLVKVFRSFRNWLVKIYRSVRNLNVELNNDVRAFMDRLLATEDEIQFAQKQSGYLQDIDFSEVDPKVAEKVKDIQEKAHEEAVKQLLKQQLKELTTERKEFLAKERESAQERFEKEIAKERPYVAIESLKDISNDHGKLLTDFIEEKTSEEQNVDLEIIAESNGYSSASEMAQEILSSPSIESKASVAVNEHMQQYADMKDTAKIKEETLKAIHSDRTLELLAIEQGLFAEMIHEREIHEEAKRRRFAQAKADSVAAKLRAEEILSEKTVKQVKSFRTYFTAERNAAVKTARALARKDFEKAAKYKRQQMLNHALAMTAMRMTKQIDKNIAALNKLSKLKPESFKRDEHFQQANSILARFGFSIVDTSNKEEPLSAWIAKMEESTNVVDIPEWIRDESINKGFRELTTDELRDVKNTVRNIRQVANFEDRAFKLMNGASMEKIVGELGEIAEKNISEKNKFKPSIEPGRFDRIKETLSQYNFNLKKINTIMQKLDGWKDFGEWQQTFGKSVYEAANEESRMMKDYNDKLVELWSLYNKKEIKEMMDKKTYYPELGASATKMRLLVMAMNLGNEGNRSKLFETPPVGVNAVEWNESVVMSLLQKYLNERDWQFVQGTWDMIEGLWPKLSSMHKELTGFEPGKVDHTPFSVISQGKQIQLKGGYFPLKQDPRASFEAKARDLMETPLYSEQNPGWKAMTKTGHTKERTAAKYPLALDITLVHRHIRDVVHDIAFRPTVVDMKRLINRKDMQDVIRRNLGPEGYATVREWIAAVAAGNTNERSVTEEWEKVVRGLRQRTVIAALAMKASVILQNFANPLLFPGTIKNFGLKESLHGFFVRGLFSYYPKVMMYAVNKKPLQQTKEFVYNKSPFMRDKMMTPDYSLMESHNKLLGKDSKIQAFATALLAGSDELTNIPMWLEAYHNELERTDNEAKAIEYADTLIDRTTGSGRKYDTAGIQRGGELAKSMSMFYSFMNTEYNRWVREFNITKEPKDLPRFLGFVSSRLLLFVTASALLSGKLPDDDEDAAAWWAKEIAYYPFSLLPGAREFAGIAMDQILGLKSYGYRPSPILTTTDTFIRAGKQLAKVAKGEGDTKDLLEASSKAAAYAFPYPDQFNTWFWNAYDMLEGNMNAKPGDFYRRRPANERR